MTLYQVCPDVQIVENENSQPGQEYFVSKGSRYFYVSSAIAELIKILQQGEHTHNIVNEMAKKHQLAEQQVHSLLNDKLPKLGILINHTTQEKESKTLEKYIKFSIPVLSEKLIMSFSNKFQHLYNPVMVVISLIAMAITFGYLFSSEKVSFLSLDSLTLFPLIFSLDDYVWLYLVLIFSYITHELGHASASMRYGIPVKKVGLGLYFIFPVFFADISKAWSLSVKKRTVINIGGTYFQLLYLAGVALYAAATGSHIAVYAIYIILNSIIISLSPFLRFDGYWIFSDIFHLPNLRTQSKQLISEVLFGQNHNLLTRLFIAKTDNKVLFYYSIFSLIFLLFIANLLFIVGVNMLDAAPALYQELLIQFSQSHSFYSHAVTAFRVCYYIILVAAYFMLTQRLSKALVIYFSRYKEES